MRSRVFRCSSASDTGTRSNPMRNAVPRCDEEVPELTTREYYDENMLHGLLISEVKDYEECIRLTEKFLLFVDNWAVCDIMSPKEYLVLGSI